MAHSRNNRETGPSIGFWRGLGHGLDRLSEVVGASVGTPDVRRNRRMAAGLIGASLAAAVLSPIALLIPGGMAALPVLLGTAVALLALASAIAAGADVDLVLVGLHLVSSVVLGLVAVAFDSLWPLALVAVGPIEAWSAGAGLRARLMIPAVLAAIGLTGFLSLHGMGPAGQGLAGTAVALPLCAAYAAFVAARTIFRLRGSAKVVPEGATLVVLDADGMTLPGDGSVPDTFAHQLHLLDRVAFLRAMDELRAGAAARLLTLRIRTGGETYRTAEVSLDPVWTASDVLAAVRLREISPRPAAVEAVSADTNQQSVFIANVSHELRTPLNAVLGFAEMLDQGLCGEFSDPRQKEYVGLIRRSSEHLLTVVNSLLDMSKIEAGRYDLRVEAFEPAEIVAASTEMVQGDADRKGLRLVVRTPDMPQVLVADRHACRQILVNLLCNAVKFTDRGTVCLTVAQDADWLTFTVSDTGIGIAPEDIDRLAQPFVQLSHGVSRRYEGTGLGLSLVKGLAELHHGSLHIRSQPERGTTVTVRIPTDCADRIQAARTHSDKIVALTDARKKTSLHRQDAQARRTA